MLWQSIGLVTSILRAQQTLTPPGGLWDLEDEFEITELLVRLKTSGTVVQFWFQNVFSFNKIWI